MVKFNKELFCAAKQGDLNGFKKHFKKDDIDTKNNQGKKLIHVTAECGHVNIIRKLLEEKKSIIDDFDEKGCTALLYALRLGKLGAVTFLVDQGANVNLGNANSGIKPIHVAASKDLLGVVDFLIKRGANIDDTDKYGRTALHRAASEASLEMVKFLHIKGANIYAEDSKGRKPLDAAKADVAKKGGRETIIKFLEKKSAIKERNSSVASAVGGSSFNTSVVRKNSFNISARRKIYLPTSVKRKDSIILSILSIFEQVRDNLNGRGKYTAEAVSVLQQLISALENNSPIIEREPLSPILREIPIESFTEVQDFLSLLRKLCYELETQIAKRLDYPKREKVLVLLDSLSRECTELKRNSNKSSLTPSVTELVHPSSNIDTAPRDISRSSQSSSFAHNGSASDDVFIDGSLFFEQQDESACAPDSGHGSGRRSSFGSASDNFIICRAVYDVLKKKGISIDLSGVDFAKAMVEMVQDEIKSQSQSESQLSKKIDNKPKAHLSDSIRDPISIFSQIESCVNKGKNEFETLLQHLRKEIQETCFNLKIGAAIGKGDCFFDSVAQALNELDGLTKDFNVKSLREDCANSCKIYRSEIINDAKKGGYFIAQKNYAFPELSTIKNEKGENVPNMDETFNKYLKNIKKTAREKESPIWGRIDIEGKIIADEYNVRIKVIELHDEPIDGLYITTCEIGTGYNIVYIVNYRNHFVPLLSGLKEDIDKKVDVSIEKVYGEKVSGQKEFNKNGSLEHQRSHSSTSFSDTASNSTESRDKRKILEGLQEIKDKIEGYNVKDEEGNYNQDHKEHITNVMEKMGNLISALRKENWLTELLKRQQEKVMFQEDLKLLHLIEEWISIFKDHVGHASLIRALKPLTEIEHCFESGNLSYEMSQGFKKKLRGMTTCCEGIKLFHDSEKEQQDHSTSDFGCDMPKFCEDEMFDCTLNNSRSLLRARQRELLSNPRDCDSFIPPFSPSLRRFDLPEDSMHAKKDLLTGSDTSALPSSKDIFKRRMSLAVHNRLDDGKLLGVCFNSAVESCKRGDYSMAIEAFGEVFDRRKSVLGYGDYNTVMARYNMAVVFSKLGRHEEALKIFLEMKDNLPKNSPYIESVEHNIDVVLSKQVISSLMVLEEEREEFLIQFDEDEIVNSSHRSSSASGRTEQEQISCPDSVTGDPNTSMDGVQQPEERETPSREGMGKWGK